ncbi:transcription factor bHLH130-like [Bidens hawaiensis]|uniref:transcription factor bHLH130-like n=1 Tax=Bidens hawaiensis TaxID=980011 RepID=UPI00404B8330
MYGVNGSSDAISRDMNSLLYSSTFKHPADGEFAKIKQLISLDPYQNQPDDDDVNDDNNRSSLLRYRSTPSSFFSNLLTDNGGADDFTPSSEGADVREFLQERKDLAPPSTAAMGGGRRVPNLPPLNGDGGYGFTNQSNLDGTSSFGARVSNLGRQNSTPAGFLSALTVENGFTSIKTGSSSSTLGTSNNHISFSLGPSSSSSRFLPQISENENELQESSFGSMKRSRDGALKILQNGETGTNTPNLVHHMSLPKTSSEMANVDNYLHFQQESTVPWKTRAKRGFATHPRSIAERERRTRISERIKRLQELFPDIDKQTNTADMLDMAVEYIKNLQKELQELNEARARCKCSSKQLQSGPTV